MSPRPPDDAPRPADAAGPPDPLAAFGETREPDVWTSLGRWRAEGRRMALLTVIESRGFTPRKPGTRMLLAEDGATAGTIGGGAIEFEVLREARELFASGEASRTIKKHLTQDLGMCCGGEMVVHLELLEAPPRLVVFGAGYLARPIAALAAGCGFAVTVVDERPEWATPERFPGMTVRCEDAEGVARAFAWRAGDHAIVVTHDHALDQRLVQHLLPHALAFTGMIGSLGKQRKFALRLRARGFDDAAIARLRTPLGVAIGAQTPEEIAVSVVAELIAARRGAAPERGWVPPARVQARAPREELQEAHVPPVPPAHAPPEGRSE